MRLRRKLDMIVAGALISMTAYCAYLTYDSIKNHDRNAPIYGALVVMNSIPTYYFLRKTVKNER
jgi:hypothetical protein